MRFVDRLQKNGKDTLTPIAPEFADLLQAVPADHRHGFVFNPLAKNGGGRLSRVDTVSSAIVEIGTAAAIKVAEKSTPKRSQKGEPRGPRVKYASAHDLRRAFGFRWSSRVMPAVLQQLMRHESIQTTLTFYAGRNAEAAADALWATVEKRPANTSANSSPEAAICQNAENP